MKKYYASPEMMYMALTSSDCITASGDKTLDLNDFNNGDSVDFVIS